VAQAYFDALTAQDNLDYARVEKTAVGKQLEFARSRAETGIARKTDLYDAEARYALSESREIEAQNALDDSFEALREHTNQAINHLTPVRDDMPLAAPDPAQPQQWIETALKQNLTLEVRQQSLEVAVKEVSRQKAGHYPTLDLVATRNRRDTNGSLLGGGSDIETTDILLRFNLPIYSGGGVQSKMHEAVDMREKSRQELEAQRRKVKRETRAAYLGVLSGIKKVEALKQSIVSQQSALEVKSAGLRAGVNTLLEVLDAQRDLYFAQSDYSKARYDYLLSTLKLKQATGSLNLADLEEVNRLIQ
jgi:outer membrane protein